MSAARTAEYGGRLMHSPNQRLRCRRSLRREHGRRDRTASIGIPMPYPQLVFSNSCGLIGYCFVPSFYLLRLFSVYSSRALSDFIYRDKRRTLQYYSKKSFPGLHIILSWTHGLARVRRKRTRTEHHTAPLDISLTMVTELS